MNSQDALMAYNKAKKDYDKLQNLNVNYTKQLNNLEYSYHQAYKQQNNIAATKINLEKRLAQVNDIISYYKKLTDEIASSNSTINKVQALYQDAISCTLSSSSLSQAFKLDDICTDTNTNSSLQYMKKEKDRLETGIATLKRELKNIEANLVNIKNSLNNLNYNKNITIKKLNSSVDAMNYYKKFF